MTGMPVTGHHAWGRAYGHDKVTRELGIIMEEEFILGVRAILHL
jgi:hypothetical protein